MRRFDIAMFFIGAQTVFYFYDVDYIAKMKYNKVIYYVQKEFVYGR